MFLAQASSLRRGLINKKIFFGSAIQKGNQTIYSKVLLQWGLKTLSHNHSWKSDRPFDK